MFIMLVHCMLCSLGQASLEKISMSSFTCLNNGLDWIGSK